MKIMNICVEFDADVHLCGDWYMKKSISIVPFYEGQLQNRFFGEDAIGRDNVYEPYRILKQILEEEYNIATCDIISIQKADIVLFYETTRRCGRLYLCKKMCLCFFRASCCRFLA